MSKNVELKGTVHLPRTDFPMKADLPQREPKVLDWWNKRWIQETVDALLDRIQDQDAVDLNSELCALLPMATVNTLGTLTRMFSLESAPRSGTSIWIGSRLR